MVVVVMNAQGAGGRRCAHCHRSRSCRRGSRGGGAKLPALVKVDDVVSAGAIPVMDRLNQCISAADQVIAFARTPEGAVRNSKLLLSASEHLRRCVCGEVHHARSQDQERVVSAGEAVRICGDSQG
jgi:hypothetical protein